VRLERAVPVLQVADVGRSIDWYAAALGFEPDPFPRNPPYSFAILRRDGAEMMLQAGTPSRPGDVKDEGWSVYLRVAGDGLLDLTESVRRVTTLVRGPERMFYGLVEFEVLDPDGYRICVSGVVPAGANVPAARECEETTR
jgi:catechol 2,3-dioxygenase-like lactoylglutathione lyase family enzyme